ncbi:hypothetical protein FHW83_005908 [Duganella sp. SG902]|nr:hypothetical protein [Duganella sp. SG902]NVM80063.1 hypothetical protein [Duganella sp. SG902]
MLKLNKMGRQARTWSATGANIAKMAYYAARAWSLWDKAEKWWDWLT